MADKFCKRPGCTKKLRSDNASGVCSSNCGSPEAAPRLQGGGGEAKSVMKRFKSVATALGKDPNKILEEAAQGWLDAVLKAIE